MIEKYIEYLQAVGKSKNTIRNYHCDLNGYLNFTGDDYSKDKIIEYILYLREQKNSNNSIIRKLFTVIGYLKFIGIPNNIREILKEIKPDKTLPRAVEVDDVKELLGHIRSKTTKFAIVLSTNTGLRLSEVLNLEKTDITSTGLIIRNTKSHKDRFVPLTTLLQQELQSFIKVKDNGNRIFDTTDKAISISLRRASKKANKKITFHQLRHTFATKVCKEGVNIKTLQNVLGHSNLNVTENYIKMLQGDITKDMEKLNGKEVLLCHKNI